MGTRGTWGFRKDGMDKLTYNHFDSYPSGLGAIIKDFICKYPIQELKKTCDRIILVSGEVEPTDEQIRECNNYLNLSVGKQDVKDWYCLLREAQSTPEEYVSKLRYMIANLSFIKDSLFCEWGYIINLDTEKLEIYKGFQKTPQNNRYHFVPKKKDDYANCKLVKEIPLNEVCKFDMNSLKEGD
jgi:hypothetical protein